jgi:protein-disulfide isomerase
MVQKRQGFAGPLAAFIFFMALVAAMACVRPVWADQPVPTLSINDVTLDESSCEGKSFVFTVTLSRLANKPVTVNYATSDGPPSGSGTAAVGGKDFVPVSGSLTFTHNTATEGPNGTYLLTIKVPLGNYVASSGGDDGREFTVNLSGATNATIRKPQGVGTMLDAASSCAPAQNAGCFVNFCGAQTACANVNRSATATPWCVLTGANGPPDLDFNACNTAGLWRDSDGDGLSDAAEAQGYIDVNANGVYDPGIDVLLPGADPNKADVYLHYDYTVASDHNHNPPPQAIQYMLDAFAAHGVNLHIDPRHNTIDESAAKVVTLQNPPDPACTGPSAKSTAQLRQQTNFGANKLAYHYMVFSHWATCDSAFDCQERCPADPECGGGLPPEFGMVGSGEIVGDDAIVSFGIFVDAGRPIPANAISGVTMHEFGHNLGLFHGGGACDNFKPNYLSVMNFNFDTTGIPVGAAPGDTVPKSCVTDADCPTPAHCSAPDGFSSGTCFRIDYSGAKLADLNEIALDETKGINGPPTSTDISTFTTDGITPISLPTNGTPVDWNQDGTIETGVTQDINGDGSATLLTGFNDWATSNGLFTSLHFNYQCSANFTNDGPLQAASGLNFQQLLRRYWLAATRPQLPGSRASRMVAPQSAAALTPEKKVQMNVGSGWYAVGRADAPVTLVEFADYQCPFCKRFHTGVYAELKKNYIDTGKVRFVSRDLPLEFHPLALRAAEAARCAGEQGKYWELRDSLYADVAPPNEEVIEKAAASVSLDTQTFQTCLASSRYRAEVQQDASDAATLGISGTPTFVLARTAQAKLEGVRIVGAQPFAAFQSAIDGLLKSPPPDPPKGQR